MEIYSPGGMFDGSIMQNNDIDHVASRHRNPVIVDIFSRMQFMERRGSGFRKIKADYRRAVNDRSKVGPLFRSTPTSFFATLYNLNYNVPIEKVLIGPKKVSFALDNLLIQNAIDGLDSTKATKGKARLLFAQIELNDIFGRNEIMSITSVSITAAGNLITKLKKAGLIESVSGYGKGKYRFKKATG